MVVGPEARGAVVPSAGPHRRRVEGVDVGASPRAEGHMHRTGNRTVRADPEHRPVTAVADVGTAAGLLGADLHDDAHAERLQGRVVEGPGAVEVARGQSQMVDHWRVSSGRGTIRSSRKTGPPRLTPKTRFPTCPLALEGPGC